MVFLGGMTLLALPLHPKGFTPPRAPQTAHGTPSFAHTSFNPPGVPAMGSGGVGNGSPAPSARPLTARTRATGCGGTAGSAGRKGRRGCPVPPNHPPIPSQPIPRPPVGDIGVVAVLQEGVTDGAGGAQPQLLCPLPALQAGDPCGIPGAQRGRGQPGSTGGTGTTGGTGGAHRCRARTPRRGRSAATSP